MVSCINSALGHSLSMLNMYDGVYAAVPAIKGVRAGSLSRNTYWRLSYEYIPVNSSIGVPYIDIV